MLRFGQWRQALLGADRGYDWATALAGRPTDFQYLVSGQDAADAAALRRFVETRIDEVEGPDGKRTRALYQALRGRGTIGATQNDFIIFDMQNAQRGYLRYWVKLQPDLLDVMRDEFDWRVLLEWKERPSFETPLDFQYRWLVMLSRSKTDGLVWKVEGDRVVPGQAATGSSWTDDWTIWSRDVPVPLGRWFLLEAAWNLDSGEAGRLTVRVDGTLVADHHGRTQLKSAEGKLYLFEVYLGEGPLRRGAAYQWVDDIELWSDTPSLAGPRR
ncbi:MAG: hypothetical protein EPO65_11960 [Dehalococcoidia bacterium]|nr:MAG: hypothetical protein EPO65_11960 [Dehalococcoidia bacterium]